MLIPSLRDLEAGLGAAPGASLAALSVFVAAFGLGQLFFGPLSDRIGRRPTLIMGWVLYAAVYFGFARASVAWQAWALFAVYGVFFGLTEGSERALIADLVALQRRGTAFGWYNLAIGLGALPASLLFGYVWDHSGPSTAFLMGATLALAAAIGLIVATSGQQQRLPGRS
ncbi:MAG TPA: MFS transporter [Gemmatimonadaceae bacterium]|nr:MFS transporter [Gemmatimonadaceae bacterium]